MPTAGITATRAGAQREGGTAPAAAAGDQDVCPQVSLRAVPARGPPRPSHLPTPPPPGSLPSLTLARRFTRCLRWVPTCSSPGQTLPPGAQGLLGPPSPAPRQCPCLGLESHPQFVGGQALPSATSWGSGGAGVLVS